MTGNKTISFGKRLVLCEVLSILMAGGYLGSILNASNRIDYFFGWLDTFAVMALVGGAGLLASGILHGLAWATRGRSDRWLSPWFYFLIVLAGFNFFPGLRWKLVRHMPWLTGSAYYLLIWGTGGILTACGYGWPRMRALAGLGWRGLAMLWPLLLILPFSLFTARMWAPEAKSPARLGRSEEGHGAPVVIVVLDMVGYGNAFSEDGSVLGALPNLEDFSKTAMVFQRARSSGYVTDSSLPGLMLQEETEVVDLTEKGARYRIYGKEEDPGRFASEFDMALPTCFRKTGGRAVYLGCYRPIKELMPGVWDEVYSLSYYGVARAGLDSPWKSTLLHHLVRYLFASKGPVAGIAKQLNLLTPLLNQYHRKLTQDILSEGKRYIRECLSPGDFLLLHLPVPHWPIVFDANGKNSPYAPMDPAGYPEQLIYADRLLGEVVASLKQADRWEDSWVIVMSDHGSHFEDFSDNPERKRHVPFLVKAPGQHERKDIWSPIRLADFDQIPGFPLALPVGAGNEAAGP